MKTTDFYLIYNKLHEQVVKELTAAVKAHGGHFEWFNEDGEELDNSYPIILVENDGYSGTAIVRSIWLNNKGCLFIDMVDSQHGFEVYADIDTIDSQHLSYIISYIPETDEINSVMSSPIEIGQEVFWNDPEGLTSGIYSVVGVPEVFEEDSVFLISNGISEAEVTIDELWVQAKTIQ